MARNHPCHANYVTLAAIAELFTGICTVEFADDGIVFDAATIQVELVRMPRPDAER